MKSARIRGLFVFGMMIVAGAAGAAVPGSSLPDKTYLALEGVGMGYPHAVTSTQTATQLDAKIVFYAADMAEPFHSGWLTPTLQGKNVLKSGEIVVESGTHTPVSTTQFTSVKPRLIEFPEVDLQAENELQFGVSFSATTFKTVTTKSTSSLPVAPRSLRVRSDYARLQIDGLDCTGTTKIGALAATVNAPTAGARGAATVSVPNLGVVMTQGSAAVGFQQWLNSGATPKSGTIEYRTPSSTTWATLSLKNLVVTKITSIDSKQSRVEMTVGGLAFALAP